MVRDCRPLSLTVLTKTGPTYTAVSRLHRQMLHRYLSNGCRKSRVMNSLAMLVESGTIYFLLLVMLRLSHIPFHVKLILMSIVCAHP